MFNVMKAQKYQLLQSNGTYYTFLAGFLLYAASCAIMMADSGSGAQLEGGSWLIFVNEPLIMFTPALTLVFTSMICGGDMDDKTINYEVMTGTRRIEVYLGRAFMSMFMSVLCCMVTLVLPLLAVTLMKGWGNLMTTADVALRIAAMILPVIRFSAFFTFIAFVMRNKTALLVSGFVLIFVEMIVSMFGGEFVSSNVMMYPFSLYSLQTIFKIENFGIGYVNGQDVQYVKDVLEMSTVGTAAISGIVGTVIFLTLGFIAFRKTDMN